ncbi:TRAPP trafficking subunit Trs65-domain-containing protein [Glomus cerebriforme]|uniref:TRAPP trafficking subunit Trs65-domain-containing protein n=1 Tax=Glomus cerebriforme TaxID=658196 RepID=A0A397S5H5_9GLOM|nr:TRAPP trafficking subunit Trs65-domain-containing protein [Glomus cerebriforme]
MRAQETLLNDLTLDIAVPNGTIQCTKEEVDSIFTTKARTIAYYDETLHFYLIITLPADSGLSDQDAATNYFHQLEIFVEASIIDASTLSVPAPNPPAVYRLPSRASSTATSPSIPGTPLPSPMDKRINKPSEGAVIYSYIYNPNSKDRQMVVLERNDCWTCVVPLVVPVAYVKTRAQTPALALSTIVTQKPQPKVQIDIKSPEAILYAPENFGNMNLLEGLNDDPSFEDSTNRLLLPPSRLYPSDAKRPNSHSNSYQSRRDFRKILSVKSALNVRMRTTSVSPLDNALMMSVELENNTDAGGSFSVEVVNVEIAYGFVTRYDWGPKDNKDKFPLTLNPVDQVTFLYNITILDDPSFPKLVPTFYPTPNPHSRSTSRRSSIASIFSVSSSYVPPSEDRQRHVSIVVRGSPVHDGMKSRSIESRWNCMLDLSNLRRREDAYPPPIPQNANQRSSLQSRQGQIQSPSSTRSGNLFSPTGSMTPTAGRSFFSADTNGRGRRQNSSLPTIPDDHISLSNGILSTGRNPLVEKPVETEVGDGVVVSFLVASKVVAGKIFTIHVFVVNRSKHVRRFTVMVPNKKRPNEKAIRNLVAAPLGAKVIQNDQIVTGNGNQSNQLEPFLDESEFIKKYLETETPDADIVCLENNVRIGPLHPSTCESVALHFIAIKESLHMIELVQLVDNDTGFITNLRNVLEIHVSKSFNPNLTKDNKILEIHNNSNSTPNSRLVEKKG